MPNGLLPALRKLGAVVLVLGSLAGGIVGLGLLVDEGRAWGLALVAAVPVGIYLATRLTPEGGTTGYFDENI